MILRTMRTLLFQIRCFSFDSIQVINFSKNSNQSTSEETQKAFQSHHSMAPSSSVLQCRVWRQKHRLQELLWVSCGVLVRLATPDSQLLTSEVRVPGRIKGWRT